MTDPMLDGITRWAFDLQGYVMQHATGGYVLLSDLPALIARVREDATETAMHIGRQIEKDNHAAGLCEPSYTHGREYEHERLTNHGMHSGLACLTNYQQGQRDEREAIDAEITADLTARIQREREDRDPDLLLGGIDYALQNVLRVIRARGES